MKKFISCLTIILIITVSFINGYVRTSPFVYADSSIEWENINSNEELRDAWLYYLKSRNIIIQGSALDVANRWVTYQMQNIANSLGLNIGQIMNNIKKADGKYLYDQNAIQFMDGITQGLLDDYNLDVGDIDVDEPVYSGKLFIDDNNNSCLCAVYYGNGGSDLTLNDFEMGTPYQNIIGSNFFHGWQSSSNVNKSYSCVKNGNTVSFGFTHRLWSVYEYWIPNNKSDYTSNSIYCYVNGSGVYMDGFCTVLYNSYENKYYIATVTKEISSTIDYTIVSIKEIPMNTNKPTTATVNIYSTEINNNDYSNNTYTTINEDGDVNNYNGNDEPPVNPVKPNPAEEWDIELPNLDINWILTGKENKFPFDIPFNLMFALSLLNAEPEAPHFEGTVDLKVYQWSYSIDLSAYDNVASVMRNLEFLAFLVGLMIMTRKLIWG